MAKRYGLSWCLVLLCLALASSSASAQWIRNGVLVCNGAYEQNQQKIISDGAQGAILVWQDYRNGIDANLYGNKIDRDGYIYDCGVPVCEAEGNQEEAQIVPDGTGGAIFVWVDYRNGNADLYAQRVDGTGTARWTENGIPICMESSYQSVARIVPDGSGGVIIVWSDYRRGQYDIYGQRVTGDGDTLWAANGMPIDTTQNDQAEPELVSDGSGGAMMIWFDNRNGDWDIYGQRIDGDGNLLWSAGGVPICLASGSVSVMRLVATPDGGAIAGWNDPRNGYWDVYAQKLDQDGNALWQADGVLICPYGSNKYLPQIAEDGSSGAIVIWQDERSEYYPTYAQRIDTDGNLVWSSDGVEVFSMYGNNYASIMADGSGGAFVALDVFWDEDLSNDIYVQRLDHDGNLLFGPKGSAVCLALNSQNRPILAPDERGGAIVAWNDYRSDDGYSYLYCQRVDPSGLWGNPAPEIVSCLDLPADQGGWVRIKTRASSHDVAGEFDSPIMGYNVWRMLAGGGGPLAAPAGAANAIVGDRAKLLALLADPATATGVRVSGPGAITLGLPPGDWESVGFWFATLDTLYNAAVRTKNDSTEAGTAEETFIVTAHTSMAGVFAASEPAVGYSVDNIAPGATPGFAGNESAAPPGLALSWTANAAADIGKYNVYRGDDASFVPDASNMIGTTDGTLIVDGSWVKAYLYFYKLVAVDKHGNASPPALLRPEDVKVGTMLASFAASLMQSGIEVAWTLSEIDEDAALAVHRSTGGSFEELASARIVRDGASYAFQDAALEPGTTYRYRVSVVDGGKSRTLFETDAISTPAMPLTLNQNHPNPFNPSTTIGYYLPVDSPVTLEVYDTSGRLVARLLDGAKQAKGTHSVEWRGLDAQGRSVSSGVYFYRLTSGKETISKKMVLLR
jgi:hypothetical protein